MFIYCRLLTASCKVLICNLKSEICNRRAIFVQIHSQAMNRNTKIISILVIVLAVGAGIFFAMNKKDKPPLNDTPTPTPIISSGVAKVFRHDTSYYTQGLVIYKGELYEGTGLTGKSRLLKMDLNTGKVILDKPLAPEFFGEGITILNDTLYQLTWQNHVVYLYDAKSKDLPLIKQIPLSTDGWGITTDGRELIVSDGSSTLYFYEPGTFKELRKRTVTENGELINNINEMEYINGFIYANRYQTKEILKIDPANGNIVGKIDLTQMVDNIKSKYAGADVLNGIAYDSTTKKIYVTGKLWPEMYEITLGQ